MSIQLSGAVRSNLLSLQNTNQEASKIQERLATGLKVNSALDNPNAFFTSKTLSGRADDLNTLLEDLGQAVQTIKAADKGLTAIENLLQNAKAKANQAIQTQDKNERNDYAKDFNSLLRQIEGIAEDSGYKGKNLLAAPAQNDLTVYFNEDYTNQIKVKARDYTNASSAAGIGIANLQEQVVPAAANITASASFATPATLLTATPADFTAGDVVTIQGDAAEGGSASSATFTVAADSTAQDFLDFLNSFGGIDASFNGANIEVTQYEDYTISTAGTGTYAVATGADTTTESAFNTDSGIQAELNKINDALQEVRSRASDLGTSLSIIETRQDFTKNIVNTLEEGSDKLVLADINEESANLLTLQTRSSLGTTALQLSAQADQSVLRLF